MQKNLFNIMIKDDLEWYKSIGEAIKKLGVNVKIKGHRRRKN